MHPSTPSIYLAARLGDVVHLRHRPVSYVDEDRVEGLRYASYKLGV
jgi:hypothetical protein